MAYMHDSHDDLRIQLETISEQLGDRIMVLLRDALEAGAPGRPPTEKLLSRARAAVDKAAGLLRQVSERSDD